MFRELSKNDISGPIPGSVGDLEHLLKLYPHSRFTEMVSKLRRLFAQASKAWGIQ
jgi:hypothetical protein